MLNLSEPARAEKKVRAMLPDPDAAAAAWLDEQLRVGRIEIHTVTGYLTPSLARLLLARNPDNRRVSADVIEKYARDIVNNNWPFNGQTISISKDGFLNDGQHRCEAVLLAGESIRVVFVFGLDRETRFTVDQGKTRIAGDYLGMHGFTDPTALAAAASMLFQYRQYGRLSFETRLRPTKGEVLAIVASTPGLLDATTRVHKRGSHTVGGRSLLGFCLFAFAERAGVTAATEFMDSLTDGAGLPARSPILYVRNRLADMRGRLNVNEKAELIFRGWNAHRRGQHPKVLPILGGNLPEVER